MSIFESMNSSRYNDKIAREIEARPFPPKYANFIVSYPEHLSIPFCVYNIFRIKTVIYKSISSRLL